MSQPIGVCRRPRGIGHILAPLEGNHTGCPQQRPQQEIAGQRALGGQRHAPSQAAENQQGVDKSVRVVRDQQDRPANGYVIGPLDLNVPKEQMKRQREESQQGVDHRSPPREVAAIQRLGGCPSTR